MEEIHRFYPTTNWVACKAMIDEAWADDQAAGENSLSDSISAKLRSLCMLRPRHLLDRFGAPTKTSFESQLFIWNFHSQEKSIDGSPKQGLQVTFVNGYVWQVSAWNN